MQVAAGHFSRRSLCRFCGESGGAGQTTFNASSRSFNSVNDGRFITFFWNRSCWHEKHVCLKFLVWPERWWRLLPLISEPWGSGTGVLPARVDDIEWDGDPHDSAVRISWLILDISCTSMCALSSRRFQTRGPATDLTMKRRNGRDARLEEYFVENIPRWPMA